MAGKSGKTGRPPFKNREEKIVSLRKYVAQEILDTGAIPNLRMLGDALGYAVSASSNIYASIRNLGDDPRIMVIKTPWNGMVITVEIFDAMRKAAQEVLDSYPDEQ
jgi:hypothetical protein